jgi:c-di-GMP-binding flagellar brake protein YcgR
MPIKDHLRRVTNLGISVSAICRKKYFGNAALSLIPPAEECLSLVLPGSLSGPVENVAVGYRVDSYLYTFEAEVIEARVDQDREATILTLNLPSRVARIERRRSPRVSCGRQESVTIRLPLPHGGFQDVSATDIGSNGAGLGLLNWPVDINVGDTWSVVLSLPKIGEIRTDVSVRAVTRLSEGQRVGVEFPGLSDEDADSIRQYVRLRQLHNRTKQKSAAGQASRPADSIFAVAVEDPPGIKQLIVCTDALLGHLADLGILSEIVSVDVMDYIEKA